MFSEPNLHCGVQNVTLPETNSSHLKMDGWNTSFSLFSGAMLVPGKVILRGVTDPPLLSFVCQMRDVLPDQ